MKHRVIIIGSGPSGLTAALYAARADLNPLVLAGDTPGGQLTWTTTVENFPGFPEGIQGPELMTRMMDQAKKFGATIELESVTSVDFSKKPFTVTTAAQSHDTEAVILASGASSKMLGVPGEEEHVGKGVATCATCDAALFRDKNVIVVGGGDAAMEDALVLTKFASHVTVMVRKGSLEEMKASKIMKQRAFDHDKTTFMFNTEVTAVHGDPMVSSVTLINNQTKEEQEFACEGMFVAIGHKPNTEFLGGQLELEGPGYVKSPDGIYTSVEGVFVGGDVQDYRYRQAITAAGLGCMAALEAERYLEGNRAEVS